MTPNSTAPLFIAKACNKIQGQYTSGASSIAQVAATAAALTNPKSSPEMQNMLKAFKERRELVVNLVNEIPNVKCNVPNGAFYVFPDVSSYYGKSNGSYTIKDGYDLCMYLLEKAYVAVVPGSAFGDNNCIRISYATSNKILIEAIGRIKKVLAELN